MLRNYHCTKFVSLSYSGALINYIVMDGITSRTCLVMVLIKGIEDECMNEKK